MPMFKVFRLVFELVLWLLSFLLIVCMCVKDHEISLELFSPSCRLSQVDIFDFFPIQGISLHC